MIFDTHSHLTYSEYNIEDEIKKMKEFGVNYSTLVGNDFNDSKKAIELARKYDCFYSVVGSLHPTEVKNYSEINNIESELEELLHEKNKIVGIGETGFDYFWIKDLNEEEQNINKSIQAKAFEIHAKIALDYDLPLIIHSRNAKEDTLKYLKEFGIKKFVIHCFSEDITFAEEIMELSNEAYIGFSGIVTFKNALQVQETVKKIFLKKILVETDAPFLAPQIVRGQKNTSAYTKYVLDKIKELREEFPEIIEKQIFENSLKFFDIKL